MLCIITCLNYVFSKLMFFLFFNGNFDIFNCSNFYFFIIVGFTYFVSQFRVNFINPHLVSSHFIRMFFRTFLYFESIHKNFVRHSKIIYISGIRQRNILNFTSFCRSRCTLLYSKFILSKK